MSRLEHAAKLLAARERLAEAVRYVTSDVTEYSGQVRRAACEVWEVALDHDGHRGMQRLFGNLIVAAGCAQVDPDAARGYVAGVRHELAVFAHRIERGRP